MKTDITKSLEKISPSLSHGEKGVLWSRIHSKITSPSISSPYVSWVRIHMRLTTVVGVFVLLLTGGITTVHANEAKPGDLLFPLDRAIERIELKLATNDTEREELGRAHAEERLQELRTLIATSDISVASNESHQKSVDSAVDALLRVMEESPMNDRAREEIYEHLFAEIDPLPLTVNINEDEKGENGRGSVHIEKEEGGMTKLEVRDERARMRIERKNGKVNVEYDLKEDGEVQGAHTSTPVGDKVHERKK